MANASVLLIETDSQYTKPLETLFSRHGIAIHIATEGHAGLQLAERVHPDLIILAVELPTINGYIVCKTFKKSEAFKDTPLILTSSEATTRDFKLHQRLRIRADEYFHKPFSPEEMWVASQKFIDFDPNAHFHNADDLLAADTSLDEQLDSALDDIFNTSGTFSQDSIEHIPLHEDAEPSTDLFVSVDASIDESHNADPIQAEDIQEVDRALSALNEEAIDDVDIDLDNFEPPDIDEATLGEIRDNLRFDDDIEQLGDVEQLGGVDDLEPMDGIEDLEPMDGIEDLELLDYSSEELDALKGEVSRLAAELAKRDAALVELQEAHNAPAQESTEHQEALAARDAQILALTQELEQARAAPDAAQDEDEAQPLQLELDAARLELNQATQRSTELERELENNRNAWEQELETMTQERSRLSDMIREFEDQADAQQKELEEVQQRLTELEAENTQLKGELDDTREGQSTQQETLTQLEEAGQESTKLIAELQAQQGDLQKQLDDTREELKTSQTTQAELKTQLEAAVERHQLDVATLQGALQNARDAHNVALGNITQLDAYTESLKAQLDQARGTFQKFTDALLGITEQLDGEVPATPEAPELSAIPVLDTDGPELAPNIAPDNAESVADDANPATLADDDADGVAEAEDVEAEGAEDSAMVIDDFDIVSEEVEAMVKVPPAAPAAPDADAKPDGEDEGTDLLESVAALAGDEDLEDVGSISEMPSLEEVGELDISEQIEVFHIGQNEEEAQV